MKYSTRRVSISSSSPIHSAESCRSACETGDTGTFTKRISASSRGRRLLCVPKSHSHLGQKDNIIINNMKGSLASQPTLPFQSGKMYSLWSLFRDNISNKDIHSFFQQHHFN